MAQADNGLILRAPRLVLDADTSVTDGALLIADGYIQDVGPQSRVERHAPASCARVDLPERTVFAGFVNAHAHLDMTNLHGVLPPGTPFGKWVPGVVLARNEWDVDQHVRSWHHGLERAMHGGAVAIGDIEIPMICRMLNARVREDASPYRLRYLEFLLPRRDVLPERLGEWLPLLMDMRERNSDTERAALSPHAPYSTSTDLLEEAVRLAREYDLPLAVHTAETQEEEQFLLQGTGGLRDALAELGVDDPPLAGCGLRPVELLKQTGVLDARPTLIHCNWLNDDDIRQIARSGCPAVFCPGTHQYFQRPPHPLRRLLDAGVPVALGTDSMASNESLSIFEEARRVLKMFADVSPADALRMLTVHGRRALGGNEDDGKLRPNASADLTVLQGSGNSWSEVLAGDDAQVTDVYIRGRRASMA